MTNLLVIPIQSFSDIVTNSSSELFVTDTKLTGEQVLNVLKEITYGFQNPIRFSLEDYRKALESDDDSDECWGYGSYYGTVMNNFVDLEDINALVKYRMEYISYYEPQYDKDTYLFYAKYTEFLNDLGFVSRNRKSFNYWDILEIPDIMEKCIKFFQEYEKSGNPLPYWWNPKERETLQYLDGKILILSESDNTIPFDTFDTINDVLNGFNIHLG